MVTSVMSLCAGMALLAAPPTASAPAQQPAAGQSAQAHTVKKPVVHTVSYKFFAVEEAVAAQTNAERARYGLPALELDPSLTQTARQQAWWMTCNRSMQHGNFPVAENIAMGQRTSSEAVQSWMNSSGHRANILNRGHRRIGVAAYTTPEGTTYWCQQFAP